MQFSHHPEIWSRFPELAAGTLYAEGIRPNVSVAAQVARFNAIAQSRLDAAGTESDLPEIKAWRGVFSRMGLKPTQYRCASESLLRRFRKEGSLPPIHPLIDLCNAASLAFAIPVAALDAAKVVWPLQVRPAIGTENYLSFSGEIEQPETGEVTFADAQGQAHARRWTHRQSGLSAIRDETASVLIVMEGVHASAAADVQDLVSALAGAISEVWAITPQRGLLTHSSPNFEFTTPVRPVPNLPHSPAADRNKQPILDILREVLPAGGSALEIASGTGQHACWFAAALPRWTWQPTDADISALPAIAAWISQAGLANVRPPLLLDVMAPQWPAQGSAFAEPFDAIYCANMLHIAPWATCAALMQGSARHLAPGGVLVTYGPYLEDDVSTAPGNLAFDHSLRARNRDWGIRRLEDVAREAQWAGLALRERHAMPSNNLLLVFARKVAAKA